MLKNFKITIEYDGGAYHGWQSQPNRPTIQDEIEKALMIMNGKKVTLIGSGRTDAGVHAYGQAANFRCDTDHDAEVFQRGLNSLTPNDIVITACRQISETFHARYDVISKIYQYRILNRPIPAALQRQYAWHIIKKLNQETMRTALGTIIGTHDFKAFEGMGSSTVNTTRCVMNADLVEKDHGYLIIEIEGDGFLRFMVRNIVGTLVDVGLEKITPSDFKITLESKDRNLAGVTAPAHGLFLMQVKY